MLKSFVFLSRFWLLSKNPPMANIRSETCTTINFFQPSIYFGTVSIWPKDQGDNVKYDHEAHLNKKINMIILGRHKLTWSKINYRVENNKEKKTEEDSRGDFNA